MIDEGKVPEITTKVPSLSQLEAKTAELKTTCKARYDEQRASCMTKRGIPDCFLTFLIAGAQGLGLSYLVATPTNGGAVKQSQLSRTNEKTASSLNSSVHPGLAGVAEFNRLKAAEVKMRANIMNNAKKDERKRNIAELQSELENSPNKASHADEIKKLKKQKRDLLREDIDAPAS